MISWRSEFKCPKEKTVSLRLLLSASHILHVLQQRGLISKKCVSILWPACQQSRHVGHLKMCGTWLDSISMTSLSILNSVSFDLMFFMFPWSFHLSFCPPTPHPSPPPHSPCSRYGFCLFREPNSKSPADGAYWMDPNGYAMPYICPTCQNLEQRELCQLQMQPQYAVQCPPQPSQPPQRRSLQRSAPHFETLIT